MAHQTATFEEPGDRIQLRDAHGQVQSYDKYAYQPLITARTIRLLRKAPSQPALGAPHFTLEHYSVDEPDLRYQAVSYCWGSADRTVPFVVVHRNGHSEVLLITPNALEAACVIGQQGDLLWIDQICINQSDIPEKNVQIRLMADIYSRCWRCSVWLGSGTEESGAAFDFLDRFAILIPDQMDMPPGPEPSKIYPHELIRQKCRKFYGQDRLPHPVDPGWHALAQLLRREWFGRLWTLQEVVLPGALRVSVVCGSRSATLKTLTRAAFCLGADMDDAPIGRASLYMISDWQPRVSRGLAIPLLELLGGLHFYNCTDQRDRIYAILGLQREEPSMPMQAIQVAYELPTVDIYISVAQSIISARRSLLICTFAPGRENGQCPSLPSWTPDWSGRPTMAGLEYFSPAGHLFNASQGRHHLMPVAANSRVLQVQGRIVGEVVDRITVDERTGRLTEDVKIPIIVEDIIPLLYVSLTSLPNALPERLIMLAIIKGLTLGGHLRTRELTDPWMQPANWSDEIIIRFCQQILRPQEPQMGAYEFRRRLETLAWETAMLAGRRYAIVGNLLGIVPLSVGAGDEIAILHGSTLPVALRRKGDRGYELLGSCYIDGMMHGERVDWSEAAADTITLV